MVRCKDCKYFLAKYETVGICNWKSHNNVPSSWKNHLPSVIFVTEEREHECPTFVKAQWRVKVTFDNFHLVHYVPKGENTEQEAIQKAVAYFKYHVGDPIVSIEVM